METLITAIYIGIVTSFAWAKLEKGYSMKKDGYKTVIYGTAIGIVAWVPLGMIFYYFFGMR